MNSQLARIAPGLVETIEQRTPAQLRALVVAVASEAVTRTELHDATISAAIRMLDGAHVPESGPTVSEVDQVVERLDERAWDIQDGEGNSDRYLAAFRQARAASAVRFAVGPDPEVQALEVVYEAVAALVSVAEIQAIVDQLGPGC